MAFVNERIADEDYRKYGLEDYDKNLAMRAWVPNRDWTVDHDRGIYLRMIGIGREEISNRMTWILYWDGEFIRLELDFLGISGPVGGVRSGHKRLRRIQIPPRLEAKRAEIIADLKEALTAWKDGGIFSSATSYTLTLDIEI